ncbi:DNA methyltransferase 1-associated protein 1 [Lepeophtheirus salmonis]|uniref:DNA methyltransferase 1-associated protein 1 n=1 Tax=Lepeophtheirus salmonis TaxID=72036 RepID=UPI001AEB8729|nr:DNA methyltransferase 1-associated protein 1-like [Lepeophtheirus salmonis]
MASPGDVRDIMGLSGGPEITKEMIMGRSDGKKKKKKKKREDGALGGEVKRRPEGMARELYNLLYGGSDSKDAPPLIPTDTLNGGPDIGYKRLKAKLGLRKVRPWIWMKFVNPARNDGLILRHWRRAADEGKDYPFSRFNKKLEIPMYTDLEYQNHLSSDGEDGKGWSRAETDHLFDLCRRFDLRFTVIHDRYSRNNASSFPQRSIEDLKERYYNVTEKLESIRMDSSSTSNSTKLYDAEHERRRKEQLIRLYNRTPEQIEEEEMLKNELKKIENRKREREKKAQDLQKLLDHAEASVTPKQEKKSQSLTNQGASSSKKKTVSVSSAVVPRSSKPDVSSSLDATTGIKFPETSKGSSIYLRSSRMKLPPSVGQKKTKAIETMLTEIQGMEMNPMPTEEIATEFNDLRSDMVLLYELKNALVVCESELQSIKAQYEALAPNKSLEIPDRLKNYFNNKEKTKSISDVIDVVGNGAAPPVRKRKAALEQSNVLKKIKNKNF